MVVKVMINMIQILLIQILASLMLRMVILL